MKHGTGFIQVEDLHSLNLLRLREFSRNRPLSSDREGILWSEVDQFSFVLGVWNRGELLASMRLEKINSLTALVERLPLSPSSWGQIRFPAAILNKAVSSKGRNNSLNALLRYHLLRLAYSNDLKDVLGFDFGSDETRVDFSYLNLEKNIETSLKLCAQSAADSLLLFPWIGVSSSFSLEERQAL